jgi:hypothetical protein
MRLVVVTNEAAKAGARSRARSAARRWWRTGSADLPAAELVTPARFRSMLPELGHQDLVYLDLSSLPPSQALARLRRLLAAGGPMIGIGDPGGVVRDIPGLFHAGAVDYLDRAAWRRGLTVRRLETVLAWARGRREEPKPAADQPGASRAAPHRRTAGEWARIRPGEEYTFSLGFVELDGGEELERRYGAADLAEALASFRAWVERSVNPYNGRIWIWSRLGGVVLFPFDGAREAAAPCFLRMTLFKQLYDVEQSLFPNFTSCRLAIHLGEVVWRDRQTGTLVSDALNTTFHLGRRFVPRGRCCAAPALQAQFTAAGEFEGRRVWLLRQPRNP